MPDLPTLEDGRDTPAVLEELRLRRLARITPVAGERFTDDATSHELARFGYWLDDVDDDLERWFGPNHYTYSPTLHVHENGRWEAFIDTSPDDFDVVARGEGSEALLAFVRGHDEGGFTW